MYRSRVGLDAQKPGIARDIYKVRLVLLFKSSMKLQGEDWHDAFGVIMKMASKIQKYSPAGDCRT